MTLESAPLTGRLVRTRRGDVEVATTGAAGPAVLAVHGTPGDWRQARALATDLAADHRVVLPSRPGYGRTRLRLGHTPREQADMYAALLDALEIDHCVVVGISGGGPSSYEFAVQHPTRCFGLVLCCAVAADLMVPPRGMRVLAAVPGAWRAAAALGRVQLRRRLADQNATLVDMRRGLSETERALLDADARMRVDVLAFAADRAVALRGAGLRNDTRQFLAASRRVAVTGPAIDLPVHVLHGDADVVVPVAHAKHYAKLIPGATVELLPGHGHALPITTRDRLAEVVRSMAAAPAPAVSAAPVPRAAPTMPSHD